MPSNPSPDSLLRDFFKLAAPADLCQSRLSKRYKLVYMGELDRSDCEEETSSATALSNLSLTEV